MNLQQVWKILILRGYFHVPCIITYNKDGEILFKRAILSWIMGGPKWSSLKHLKVLVIEVRMGQAFLRLLRQQLHYQWENSPFTTRNKLGSPHFQVGILFAGYVHANFSGHICNSDWTRATQIDSSRGWSLCEIQTIMAVYTTLIQQ